MSQLWRAFTPLRATTRVPLPDRRLASGHPAAPISAQRDPLRVLKPFPYTPPDLVTTRRKTSKQMTEYSYDPEERFAAFGALSLHDEMGAEPTCTGFVHAIRKEANKRASEETGRTELSWDPTRRFNALAWAVNSPRTFHIQWLRTRRHHQRPHRSVLPTSPVLSRAFPNAPPSQAAARRLSTWRRSASPTLPMGP